MRDPVRVLAPCSGARRHGAGARSMLLVLLLSGCSGTGVVAPLGRAPQRDAPAAVSGMHRVESGETLYAIAWRYGLDYRDLALWNGIGDPFTIHPGQSLHLSRPAVLPPQPAPEASPRVAAAPAPARTPAPAASGNAPPRAGTAAKPPSVSPARDERAVSAWQWPARGKVTGAFAQGGGKGIDIEGAPGSPVVAAAPGHVVYSGSGLRGYGKLIILKHNKRYLSAYAHNDRLHVKEGDTVKSGQRIADMGNTDAKTVRLHFEIRRDGKPVDPTRYLPR